MDMQTAGRGAEHTLCHCLWPIYFITTVVNNVNENFIAFII